MLSGKKTYILAGLGALYAIIGFVIGQLDAQTALNFLWASLGLGALRAGITNG